MLLNLTFATSYECAVASSSLTLLFTFLQLLLLFKILQSTKLILLFLLLLLRLLLFLTALTYIESLFCCVTLTMRQKEIAFSKGVAVRVVVVIYTYKYTYEKRKNTKKKKHNKKNMHTHALTHCVRHTINSKNMHVELNLQMRKVINKGEKIIHNLFK